MGPGRRETEDTSLLTSLKPGVLPEKAAPAGEGEVKAENEMEAKEKKKDKIKKKK